MNEIFLAIFFIVNGEPTIIDGWAPLAMESMEDCVKGKASVETRIEYMQTEAVVFCGTREQIQREIDILNDEQV